MLSPYVRTGISTQRNTKTLIAMRTASRTKVRLGCRPTNASRQNARVTGEIIHWEPQVADPSAARAAFAGCAGAAISRALCAAAISRAESKTTAASLPQRAMASRSQSSSCPGDGRSFGVVGRITMPAAVRSHRAEGVLPASAHGCGTEGSAHRRAIRLQNGLTRQLLWRLARMVHSGTNPGREGT